MFKKIIVFVLVLLFSTSSAFSQCAMCKAVVENGDVDMAEGVNNGITYLMIFPYILVGFLLFALYRYRKQQAKN
ncbi:hypothetical protein [Winogradskyella sp.]|uniref:hypothetical protein n=1 Tax=Winogradskyella sp. TaxID=1883156 RepID=UPI0025DE5412|nr:hypothetical protein [Winogradskyella sp.]MBT8244687.1 hypothetical protein [Winogradskyella sp.]